MTKRIKTAILYGLMPFLVIMVATVSFEIPSYAMNNMSFDEFVHQVKTHELASVEISADNRSVSFLHPKSLKITLVDLPQGYDVRPLLTENKVKIGSGSFQDRQKSSSNGFPRGLLTIPLVALGFMFRRYFMGLAR